MKREFPLGAIMNSSSRLLLPDLDVELVAEFLLIPQLPKPNARGRVNIAQGLLDHEVARAEIAAPNLEAADVERAALETERLLRVHLQRHGGQSFRLDTLRDAAREITERLDVLEYGERDPVFAQFRPEAPHVAEQVLVLPTEEPERPGGRRGAGRWRRRLRAEGLPNELLQGRGEWADEAPESAGKAQASAGASADWPEG